MTPANLAPALALVVVGLLLLALAALLLNTPEHERVLTRLPTASFAIGSSLFLCLGGAFLLLSGDFNYTEFGYTSDAVSRGVFHVISFCLTFGITAGLVATVRPVIVGRQEKIGAFYGGDAFVLLLLPLLGLAALILRATSLGLLEYFADRINATAGLGYAVALSRLSMIATVILFAVPLRQGRWVVPARVLAMLEVLLGLLLMGSRTDLVLVVVAVFLVRRLTRNAVSIVDVRTFSLATVLGVVVVTLGAARQYVLASDETIHFGEFVIDDLGNQVKVAVVESETAIWLEQHPGNWDLSLGATYAAATVGLVPRRLWSGKPLGAGPRLKNAIRPESYQLGGRRQISSYTPGVVGEAVMNFGAFGPPLAGVFFALFLALGSYAIASTPSPLGPAAVALASIISILAVKAEFFGLVARVFSMLALPLVLLSVNARIRTWRQH